MPSRRIVIDADVIQAAGGLGAPSRRSHLCSHILTVVYDVCHRVVLIPAITQEFANHRSRFSNRWLNQMYGRKKVYLREDEPDRTLEEVVAKLSAPHRDTAVKDIHVARAARLTDGIVLSCDANARVAFSQLELKPLLAEVLWANPEAQGEETADWLRRGAPSEAIFRLFP